jgi:virginiamycin B lyase
MPLLRARDASAATIGVWSRQPTHVLGGLMGDAAMFRLLIAAAALLLAPGTARAAEMTFYQLPSGSFPHDVAPAPDGRVWFTGQRQGFMGLFDPKSGNLEKIPLGPGAAPHGVVVGTDGAAWVTEGGQNAIARVDPVSKAVKLYPLPKQFAYANLNTPTIDNKGVVWFTGQSGVYGRVDPATGKVDAWASPKGRGPYGMATTPSGEVWYASLAGDHIATVDTTSGAVIVVDPPKPGVGPRRVWSDSKGVIWVSFWSAGAIGR